MTKRELIAKAAKDTIYTKMEVRTIFAALEKHMLEAFQNEDDIVLQGFGSYHIKTTPAHRRRHLHTKKVVVIPEKKSVTFTVTPMIKIGKVSDDSASQKPTTMQ